MTKIKHPIFDGSNKRIAELEKDLLDCNKMLSTSLEMGTRLEAELAISKSNEAALEIGINHRNIYIAELESEKAE